MRAQVLLWFAIGVNLFSASMNVWLMHRRTRQQRADIERIAALRKCAAMCSVIAEHPGTPEHIRVALLRELPEGYRVKKIVAFPARGTETRH